MFSLIFDKETIIGTNSNEEEIREALNSPDQMVWLDLDEDATKNNRLILNELFHFHPLAVDDALVETHMPKIDNWDNYLYIVFSAIDPNAYLKDIDKLSELDVFVSKKFLVTYHSKHLTGIDVVKENLIRNKRKAIQGTNYILYQILDELSNDYMKLIDMMDSKIDEIGDSVLKKPQQSLLQEIFDIKRSLMILRRMIAPQREVLNKLSRGDFQVVNQSEQVYYRDIYDHMIRVHDITENLRDLVSGALDTYLSVVNNRLNDIMKTLTIITTIFMPLSFLTGFFGMNFFSAGLDLNVWTGVNIFYIILAAMILIPFSMFLWMRKRKWM